MDLNDKILSDEDYLNELNNNIIYNSSNIVEKDGILLNNTNSQYI